MTMGATDLNWMSIPQEHMEDRSPVPVCCSSQLSMLQGTHGLDTLTPPDIGYMMSDLIAQEIISSLALSATTPLTETAASTIPVAAA